MLASGLGDALFTKTQQRVLGLLFGKPEQSYYLNEIARLINTGKGALMRELERMVETGIVRLSRVGNQTHYQANPACPVYEELLSITRKTFGLAEPIKTALQALNGQVGLAFVYGSVAKGQDTGQSDVDLFLLGDDLAYADVMQALVEVEEAIGRPINPSIYNKQQVIDRLRERQSFMTRIMEQPKLWIKGSDSDIAEIRQSGEDQAAGNYTAIVERADKYYRNPAKVSNGSTGKISGYGVSRMMRNTRSSMHERIKAFIAVSSPDA